MKHPNLSEIENFEAYVPTQAELRAAKKRALEPAETPTARQRTISWICCLIAAGITIETLFFKFTGAAESVYIFKRMGTEPWRRWGQRKITQLSFFFRPWDLFQRRFRRAGKDFSTRLET